MLNLIQYLQRTQIFHFLKQYGDSQKTQIIYKLRQWKSLTNQFNKNYLNIFNKWYVAVHIPFLLQTTLLKESNIYTAILLNYKIKNILKICIC